MTQTFQELQKFIGEQTARKPRKKPQPKAETANQLTRKIVSHIRQHGGFATRLNSVGVYREDLRKFVPSQQINGLPDVTAIVCGRSVWVEVKIGTDRLSEQQKETIRSLIAAGAAVYVAYDFAGFVAWFTELLPLLADNEVLPFGPTPRTHEHR